MSEKLEPVHISGEPAAIFFSLVLWGLSYSGDLLVLPSSILHFAIMPSSGPRPIPQDLGNIASDKNKLHKQTEPQSSSWSKNTTKHQGTDEKGPESIISRDPKVLGASVCFVPLA